MHHQHDHAIDTNSHHVQFQDGKRDTQCKLCGDKCARIIYKAFAACYISRDVLEAKESDQEAIDLSDEIQVDDNDITNEDVLVAKRSYLRYHYKDEESEFTELLCSYNQCNALRKAKVNNFNLLNELEQAHITFYHKNIFDRHWKDRHRSTRYGIRILSNADLPQENKANTEMDDDDGDDDSEENVGFSSPPLLAYQSSKKKELKQLSVDMFSEFLTKKTANPSPNNQLSPDYTPNNANLSPSKPKLPYTKSVRYQQLFVKKQKQKKPATDVVLFGYEFTTKHAKFKNPKEEVLKSNMENVSIEVAEWNTLLKGCVRYVKVKSAKHMRLNMKEVVGLKLYTDFDQLQREFRKCFRITNKHKRIEMQKNFVHWNALLVSACKKAKDDVKETLYHGVASLNKTSTFNGKYYGPVSTTTVFDVAKQFSGNEGTVLVLHSAYSKAGIRLSWLSNYPDEDEVLYMNVTFQIIDIMDPQTEKSKLLPMSDKYDKGDKYHMELEQIKNSLQNISVNSNVLSLNKVNKHKKQNVIVINELSVFKTLYLQYNPQRWDEICQQNTQYAETLTALRDQFVHLIEKVKAVEMHQTSPLIQHFFSMDQKTYEPPVNSAMEIDEFHDSFEHNVYYFKLQTIIRLFPNAEEISINAKNWDFTLNEMVSFLNKWKYDYTAIPLKYISIKFEHGANNKTCDERAIEELEKHHAARNISRLLKLGWKFLTPATLSRVPFEPAPELPFLLTFVQKNKDNICAPVFYRRYTQQLLNRASSHKSVEGDGDDEDDDNYDYDEKDDGAFTEIHHNPKICILSTDIWNKTEYKNDVRKMLKKAKLNMLSPKGPGANRNDSFHDSFLKACYDVNSLILDPLPKDLIDIFKTKQHHISYQVIDNIFPNVCDIFLRNTQFTLEECQRLSHFLKDRNKNNGYVPFERIFYKEKINNKELPEDELNKLKKSPSMLIFIESEEDKEKDGNTQKMAKMLNNSGGDWSFQENGQIAFCNDIFKHLQTKYEFNELEAPGV